MKANYAILAALILVQTSCTMPENCLRYLDQDVAVTPDDGDDVDSTDYNGVPIEFMACRANGGNQRAQIVLAKAFEEGRGVPQSYQRAFRWYKRAASTRMGLSDYTVPAQSIDAHSGVLTPDPGKRQSGSAEAQFALGVLFLEGRGVDASQRKAKRWFKRAAGQGHMGAIMALSEIEDEKQ